MIIANHYKVAFKRFIEYMIEEFERPRIVEDAPITLAVYVDLRETTPNYVEATIIWEEVIKLDNFFARFVFDLAKFKTKDELRDYLNGKLNGIYSAWLSFQQQLKKEQ